MTLAIPMTPLFWRASEIACRKGMGPATSAAFGDSSDVWASVSDAVSRQALSASARTLRKPKLNLRYTGLRDISRRVPLAKAERLRLVQLIEGLPGTAEA